MRLGFELDRYPPPRHQCVLRAPGLFERFRERNVQRRFLYVRYALRLQQSLQQSDLSRVRYLSGYLLHQRLILKGLVVSIANLVP
jgi:hypothetical protein